MPLKCFQENYWNISEDPPPPPDPVISRGGYPGWQASVIGAAFGAWWHLLMVWVARVRWAWHLARRVEGLDDASRAVLLRALERLEDPAFMEAYAAVKQTAKTLGFNRPEAWKSLSHALKREPGHAENTFRHLHACEGVKAATRAAGRRLSNPDINLLVELAYHRYTVTKGRDGDV